MNLLAIISLTTIILSSQVVAETDTQTSFEKLYSSSGYPYDMLINRGGTIKIIYSANKHSVECSVVLEKADLDLVSPSVVVNKEKFEKRPLASCLARDIAKQWLSKTF